MEFHDFERQVQLMEEKKALRERYVHAFVDTKSEYYAKRIQALRRYKDGLCYDGYLWDCLRDKKVVDFAYVKSAVKNDREVFVMWDIHSEERIFIEDYWRFGKDSILRVRFDVLLDHLAYVPEDLYLFDDTFSWTIALTHEEIDGQRWCLSAEGEKK